MTKMPKGIQLEVNKTGRKITVVGPDDTVIVRQGVGDGQWRLDCGNGDVELVSSKEAGLEEAFKLVDKKYSYKKFKELCEIAKEGEGKR